MTPEEALAAVKKAVDQLHLQGVAEWGNLIAAVQAISPSGPLVVVPKRLPHQPRMNGHCDVCGCPLPEKGVAWAGEENDRFYYCPDHWPDHLRKSYNAMLEAGEKQP